MGRDVDRLTHEIIGAAIAVHRALGPGLLESAYEACLAFELTERGLKVEQQKPLPVVYREVRVDCGYRLDLLVEDSVIVELKPSTNWRQSMMHSYSRISGWPISRSAFSSISTSRSLPTAFAAASTISPTIPLCGLCVLCGKSVPRGVESSDALRSRHVAR
jgi:GxxExxY protein